jgi:hypothetical protein
MVPLSALSEIAPAPAVAVVVAVDCKTRESLFSCRLCLLFDVEESSVFLNRVSTSVSSSSSSHVRFSNIICI